MRGRAVHDEPMAGGTKGAFAFAFLVAACHPTPAPDAGPPVASFDDAGTSEVVAKLVEAGCLAADDSGDDLVSTAKEHAAKDYVWLECLYAGGSVASCNAPCGGDR